MTIYPDSIGPIVCERINKAHDAIRHAINALADSLIQSGVLVTRDQMEEMAQGIAEALSDDIVDEVQRVRDANGDVGHYPEDYDAVIDAAVERVIDSFRPKPVSCDGLFESLRDILTSPAGRCQQEHVSLVDAWCERCRLRPVPQNPRTHADLGSPL